jgi:hypothetical protein
MVGRRGSRFLLTFAVATMASVLIGAAVYSFSPRQIVIMSMLVWIVGVPLGLWQLWRRVGEGGLKRTEARAIQWNCVSVVAIVVVVASAVRSATKLGFADGFLAGGLSMAGLWGLYRTATLVARIGDARRGGGRE